MEKAEVCEVSLALRGLDVGTVVSATSPRVGEGHGRCPKWPSLEILSLRIAVGFARFLLVRGWDLPQAPEGGWVCAHPSHTARRQPCPLPPACSRRLPPAPAPNPGPSLPHRPHRLTQTPNQQCGVTLRAQTGALHLVRD